MSIEQLTQTHAVENASVFGCMHRLPQPPHSISMFIILLTLTADTILIVHDCAEPKAITVLFSISCIHSENEM